MFMISAAVPALALSAELSARRREEEHQRQRALETEVLWQASIQVAQGGSLEELLRDCLEKICKLTGWPVGHVVLPDDPDNPKVLLPSPVWHFSDDALKPVAEETKQFHFRFGEGLPGRIWEDGRPLWVPNIAESRKSATKGRASEVRTPSFSASQYMRRAGCKPCSSSSQPQRSRRNSRCSRSCKA